MTAKPIKPGNLVTMSKQFKYHNKWFGLILRDNGLMIDSRNDWELKNSYIVLGLSVFDLEMYGISNKLIEFSLFDYEIELIGMDLI